MEPGAERPDAEEPPEERARRASSFGAAAAQYAQHRPGYASEAIRWCLAPVSDARPLRVVDLGAGTGILSRALANLGADVVAVEPDKAMLAELRRQLPEVKAAEGSAEALPLPDQSADAVLCGQAMHWFDLGRALPEIARVLRPGGVLAGLWNVEDDRLDWVAKFCAMAKTGSTLLSWREVMDGDTEQAVLRTGSSWFAPVEQGEFGNEQVRNADSLIGTIATTSRLLVMDDAERAATLATIRDFLQSRPETSAGEFTVPLVTVTLRAVRR